MQRKACFDQVAPQRVAQGKIGGCTVCIRRVLPVGTSSRRLRLARLLGLPLFLRWVLLTKLKMVTSLLLPRIFKTSSRRQPTRMFLPSTSTLRLRTAGRARQARHGARPATLCLMMRLRTRAHTTSLSWEAVSLVRGRQSRVLRTVSRWPSSSSRLKRACSTSVARSAPSTTSGLLSMVRTRLTARHLCARSSAATPRAAIRPLSAIM